ncbi:histone H1/5, partial [Clonorchis sinensis]
YSHKFHQLFKHTADHTPISMRIYKRYLSTNFNTGFSMWIATRLSQRNFVGIFHCCTNRWKECYNNKKETGFAEDVCSTTSDSATMVSSPLFALVGILSRILLDGFRSRRTINCTPIDCSNRWIVPCQDWVERRANGCFPTSSSNVCGKRLVPGFAVSKKPKSAKPKIPANHPPVIDMVKAPINAVKDRKGTSLPTIKVDVEKLGPQIRRGIVHAVEKGVLVCVGNKGKATSTKVSNQTGTANVLYYKNESSYTQYKITNLNGFRQTAPSQTILGADFLKSTDSMVDLKQGKLMTSYGAVKLEGYPSTAVSRFARKLSLTWCLMIRRNELYSGPAGRILRDSGNVTVLSDIQRLRGLGVTNKTLNTVQRCDDLVPSNQHYIPTLYENQSNFDSCLTGPEKPQTSNRGFNLQPGKDDRVRTSVRDRNTHAGKGRLADALKFFVRGLRLDHNHNGPHVIILGTIPRILTANLAEFIVPAFCDKISDPLGTGGFGKYLIFRVPCLPSRLNRYIARIRRRYSRKKLVASRFSSLSAFSKVISS